MNNRITTGSELKRIRSAMKINRTQLARETGLSPSALQKIEDGRRGGSPETWDIINKYIKTINTSNYDLMSQVLSDIKKYTRNQLVRLTISTQNKGLRIFRIEKYEIVENSTTPGVYTTLGNLKKIL